MRLGSHQRPSAARQAEEHLAGRAEIDINSAMALPKGHGTAADAPGIDAASRDRNA